MTERCVCTRERINTSYTRCTASWISCCVWHRAILIKSWGTKQQKQMLKQSNCTTYTRLLCSPVAVVCWLLNVPATCVSQGWICSDNFTCCHSEIEFADQNFHLIQSQYTDTRPTSPSTDPITPGAWQGSHWSTNF